MAVTVTSEYAGAALSSHDVPLGSLTPGRYVLLFAAAAAVLSVPAGWTRVVNLVSQTAGSVYLRTADGTEGATVTITLSGPRALSAVVVEFESDTAPSVDFAVIRDFVASETQTWSGTVPAPGSGESSIAAALLCSGTFFVSEIPAVQQWDGGLVEVGDSGTVLATNEDARVSVAETDGSLSGTLSVQYTASWNAGGAGVVIRYTPSGTVEVSGGADVGTVTGVGNALSTTPIGGNADVGGVTGVAMAVVPTRGILAAILRTDSDLVASLTGVSATMVVGSFTGGGNTVATDTISRSWLSREPVEWSLTLADGSNLTTTTVEVAFVAAGTDIQPDDASWTEHAVSGSGTAEVTLSVLVGPTGDLVAEVALGQGSWDCYIRPTIGDQAPVRAGRLNLS